MTATSIRARVRAEMIGEIKEAARRHLAVDGSNLSLRAVARDLGTASSALYRYFASRDDLLTALIIDAYTALADAVEQADAAVARGDLRGRWFAACHAVRDWALANPHEYALIYGSPVPGYHAPQDTVEPATRPNIILAGILADGVASGVVRVDPDERLPDPVYTDVKNLVDRAFPGAPPTMLARGLTAWIQLFGLVSFELFGRLNNVIADRAAYFDHQMAEMATLVGL